MADWGQNDEVVTPAKTVAPAAKQTSSWGQDDEVVTKPAAKETKPGFLEKSMSDYTKKQEERVSGAGAFASSYLESVGASPFALAGARGAMAIPQPVWAKPVTGIVGGVAGGYLGSMGITSLEGVFDKVFGTDIVGTREKQRQEYPGFSLAGSVVGGSVGPFMRPGLPDTIKQAAIGSGVMTGIGAGQRAIEGQPVLDPKSMAIDVATGAFTKPTKLGEKVLGQTAPVTKPKPEIKKEEVTPPPPGATPEQVDDFKAKVKKESEQRTSSSPLVEAAIRNKETGAIERMGPKHDEARKAETLDTHDQGFLDERGNFLTRQEAVDRAVNTGQVPIEKYTAKEIAVPSKTKEDLTKNIELIKKDISDAERSDEYKTSQNLKEQLKELEKKLKLVEEFGPTEPKYREVTKTRAKLEIPEDGLHSGDLRKAGDERFKITEEQPAGIPKPISPEDVPVDRTKTSPRDVKDDKEFLSIAADIYEKHGEVEAVEFFKGWEEFKKTWPEPVKQVEEFVGLNLNNKEADARIIHNNTAELKELAGNVDLDKLSFEIDTGVPLEGKAKEVATKFRTLMDELGKRALEKGVIKGWHEDYVARNVVSEGAVPPGAFEEFMRDAFGYGKKASGDGTKTTTKYGQERKLKTREDLVSHINGINEWLAENGKNYRFKLKTNNLAEIYKDYALSVEKAIENKNLIENIKQIRNDNGESLIKPISSPEDLPYGWKQIDHPDLAGYAVHSDLVPALKFVFDAGPGMTMQALGLVSQVVKRMNVIGSFFHAKSLMEVQSSAKIPLWTPLKESIVLPLVEKSVKAVTGKNLQLSAVTKAVEQYKKGGLGDNVDRWIRESGLQLEVPEDVARGILSSTGKLADRLIAKFGPKTRILESSLSTVEKYTLGMFDKYTWDYLHTGSKIMVADAYLEKARLQAAKEGKPFDEAVSRKQIAQFVNDSFGGLNWFDAARRTEGEFAKRMAMAAYSPEGRRALQVALFAPDWTISTVRAFTAALPKNLNPTKWQPIEGIKGMMAPTTKADYARLYQFKTALVYFTLINAINNMTAGRDVWDNKDPTRIEWPDGTSMQAMKHAMEPYHWIADPDKTLSNKMGFIPKALIIGFGGVEYASATAPKLVDLSGPGRLKAAVSTALPFQIQAGAAAPEGEGAKRALLGTMGFPVYGKTAEQNKQARAERELATKENAWKYRDKEIKKGRMEWTPKHDQEKRALDKRREKLNKEAE
jgi:hypothetical protein